MKYLNLIVVFIFLLSCSLNVLAQTAALVTDSLDYQPGSTATINGNGFQPGESVQLQVLHADYHAGDPIGEDHEPWHAVADSSGNIFTTWHVCEDDCLGKLLRVTAIGQSSGIEAESFFTDATVTTTGSGNWSSTINNAPWSGGTIPATVDDIIVGPGFTLTVNDNRTCNSITLTNGASLIVNSGVTLTIIGGVILQNLMDNNTSATISGLGTISANSLTVISVDGNGSNGVFSATINSSITSLNITGNITINSNRGNNDLRLRHGVLNVITGTVEVSGGIITVNENALNTSTLTLAATAPQDGTLKIGGTTPFTLSGTGANTITLNGTSATVEYSRLGNQLIQTTSPPVTYTNLKISGSGTKTPGGLLNVTNLIIGTNTILNTTNSVNTSGNWTVDGTFTQTQGTTTFTGGGTHTFSGAGSSQFNNLTTSSQTINAGSHNIRISTDWTHGTAGVFNAQTSTVTFNGLGAQSQPLSSVFVPSLYKMIINKTGGTMGTRAWIVNNNFELINGSFLPGNNSSFNSFKVNGGTFTSPTSITVSGNWTNDGGSFNPGTNTVTFNGASQTIGGNNPTTFGSLTIAGSGDKTLGNNITVNGILNLTSNLVTTGSNVLTVTSIGSIIGGSLSSYVNGKLARGYTAAGLKVFPIGKGGNYRPIALNYTALTGISTATVEQFETGFNGTLPLGTTQLGTRYLNVTESGSISRTYELTLNGAGLTRTPGSSVKMLQYNTLPSSTTLSRATTETALPEIPTGYKNTTGLTSFSDFALGETVFTTTTASNSSATYGDASVNLTATISPSAATGNVEFFINNTSVGTAPIQSGNASLVYNSSSLDANNYTIKANYLGSGAYQYSSSYPNNNSNLTITARDLILSSFIAGSKVYDANTDVLTGAGFSDNRVSGDVLAFTYSKAFADKNVGVKNVNFTTLAISGGTDQNNYSLVTTTGTATANITARAINVTAQTDSRDYNGTNSSSVAPVLDALRAGDITTTPPTQTYHNKHVATGKTLTASGWIIYDGNSGNNYSINYVQNTTGVINVRAINVTALTSTKVYDGTISSTVVPAYTLQPGDLTATPPIEVYNTPLAVIGKTMTASGLVINDGNSGNNYNISYVQNFTGVIISLDVTSSVSVLPASAQYSDQVTLTAKIAGGAPLVTGGPKAAQSATFKIGTQIMGTSNFTVSGADIVATLSVALLEPSSFGTAPTGQMAPGSRTVTAVINSSDPNFSVNPLLPATPITITREDANVTYSGLTYFSTASASSLSATITLSATLTDMADAVRGDIRNASVTFYKGSISGPQLGTANLQPVLINNADTKVGTVTTTFTYTLTSNEFAAMGTSFEIYAVVNNYYSGNNNGDPGMVTVSVPGSDAVTGGGYLNMTNPLGPYAGTVATKTNFGFTMKYAKNGSGAKGQCNIIVRRDNKIYQIKSNAINSLSVGGTTSSGTPANFITKANLTDITNPLAPISISGNLDLFMNMNDISNGGQNDQLSILLQSGSAILFSSNWNGTKTVLQNLGGGNVQVKNTTTASIAMANSPISDQNSGKTLVLKEPTFDRKISLSAYPNPFAKTATVIFTLPADEQRVILDVYDLKGSRIKRMYEGKADANQTLKFEFDGSNLPTGVYLLRLSTSKNVENFKIIMTE